MGSNTWQRAGAGCWVQMTLTVISNEFIPPGWRRDFIQTQAFKNLSIFKCPRSQVVRMQVDFGDVIIDAR